MSSLTEENQENMLKWVIRYVMIPVSLAVITGLFAIEVIDREIASRNQAPQAEVDYGAIFATMTAVAPQPQPEATATRLPSSTPTEEASLETTPVVEAPGVNVAGSQVTAVCGQVPAGWRLYTVQSGNTLFSLARQSGTTIGAIQQANCLYSQLMAYSQIWLPPFFASVIIEPLVTVTPTITVTEEVALPDLINDTRDWPTALLSCEGTVCSTTVNLAVTNAGTAVSNSFDVLVRLDPEQSVVITGVMDGLAPGQTGTLTLTSPFTVSCYDPDCTVCISVDNRGAITESDEGNNQHCTTFTDFVGGG